MADNLQQIDPSETTQAAQTTELRIVLIGDDRSLRSYGPVLRRVAIGLIDEVQDLTLLCLETSSILEYIPTPPVRIITESRQYLAEPGRFEAITSRRIAVPSPRWPVIDCCLPQHRAVRLANALQPYKPTLIHAISEKHADLTRRIALLLNIPYIISLLNIENSHLNTSCKDAAAVLPCNSTIARTLKNKYPQKRKHIHFLPIGTHVDPETCCFKNENVRPSIICCAPLKKTMGLQNVVDAVLQLTKIGRNPLLTFAGEGSYEYPLRNVIKKNQMAGFVQFIPPIEKLIQQSDAAKQLLKNADIFIQPFPVVEWRSELLEAMSVGNAVIAADGVKNDLVIEGKTARQYACDDTSRLADILNDLLTNRPQTRQLAQNAQAFLKKHFLASQMVERLATVYRSVLNPPQNR